MNYKLPSSWLKNLSIEEAEHYVGLGLVEVTDWNPFITSTAIQIAELKSQLTNAEDNYEYEQQQKNELIEDLRAQLSAYER